MTTGSSADGDSSQVTDGTGLTLLRLGLWTGEMQLKIKMMVEVVEDAKSQYMHPGISWSALT